jgi:hypothetical protein
MERRGLPDVFTAGIQVGAKKPHEKMGIKGESEIQKSGRSGLFGWRAD